MDKVLSIAVEDLSTWGIGDDVTDIVILRLVNIAITLDKLQIARRKGKKSKDGEDYNAEYLVAVSVIAWIVHRRVNLGVKMAMKK